MFQAKREFITDEDRNSKGDEQILFSTFRESVSSPDFVYVKRYVNWKGMSPTEHVGWFIAQAYLVNLLYTAERDYAATVETCDKILDTNNLSDQNVRFAQRTFPVAISTEWSEIFDSGIHAVIGYYYLCSFLLQKARQSDARSISESVPSTLLSISSSGVLEIRAIELACWNS